MLIALLGHSQNIITISDIIVNGNKVTKENIILREIVFSQNTEVSISDLEERIKESKENYSIKRQ